MLDGIEPVSGYLYIYLSPLIPLSFKGEGEEQVLKGLCPFKLPLINNPVNF
jgi:hypothetical protein